MKRWALFTITLLLISTIAFAQAAVTPSGQATTSGAAVPMAPISPPLVTAPMVHLGNAPTSNVGTSTAAITSNPSAAPEPPTAVPMRAEIDLGPQTVYVGPTNTAAQNDNSNSAQPQINGRQVIDLGVHSGAANSFDDGTHGRSLGEIARENRQRSQAVQARTFTNADVERAAGSGGISGIATNQNGNAIPDNNGVINPNGVATSTGAPNSNAPAGVATPTANVPATQQNEHATPPNVQPNPGPEPYNGQPQQKPSATTPHQMAQAKVPANPADQNAAAASNANDQNNDQNKDQKTLPKSGSFLPLMAVVGLGATVAGLMSRQ